MDYSFNKVFTDLYKDTDTVKIKICPAQNEYGGMTNIGIRAHDYRFGIIDDVIFLIYGDIYINDRKIDMIDFLAMSTTEKQKCEIILKAQAINGPLIIHVHLGTYGFVGSLEGLDDIRLDLDGYYYAYVKRKD